MFWLNLFGFAVPNLISLQNNGLVLLDNQRGVLQYKHYESFDALSIGSSLVVVASLFKKRDVRKIRGFY